MIAPTEDELEREEHEAYDIPYLIIALCEILGTAILMLIGCLGCLDNQPELAMLMPSLAFAFAILLGIQSTGHFCPLHINPAITGGLFCIQKLHWTEVLVYFTGQTIGAFIGYTLLWALIPGSLHDGLCLLYVRPGVSLVQAFFLESIGTMLMMLLLLGATDRANRRLTDSVSLRLIFGIAGIILTIAPLTGCGINPIRALIPALVLAIAGRSNWKDLWLYLTAPFVGAIFGGLLYRHVFDASHNYSLNHFLSERHTKRKEATM